MSLGRRMYQRTGWLQLSLSGRFYRQRDVMCGTSKWHHRIHHTEHSVAGTRTLAVRSMRTECCVQSGHLSMSGRLAWWWCTMHSPMSQWIRKCRRRMHSGVGRRRGLYVNVHFVRSKCVPICFLYWGWIDYDVPFCSVTFFLLLQWKWRHSVMRTDAHAHPVISCIKPSRRLRAYESRPKSNLARNVCWLWHACDSYHNYFAINFCHFIL